MKSAEFRQRLLVALFLVAQRDNLAGYFEPKPVADEFHLERRPGQLRLVIDDLEERGWIIASRTMGGGDEGGLQSRLTNAGVEAAEDFLESNPEYAAPDTAKVPAADRYVSIGHNERAAIGADIEALRSAANAANEVSEEDRLIGISEIAAFEAATIQPRVSKELIDRFVMRILVWLRKTFGEALMGAIAGALVVKLLPFLAS